MLETDESMLQGFIKENGCWDAVGSGFAAGSGMNCCPPIPGGYP